MKSPRLSMLRLLAAALAMMATLGAGAGPAEAPPRELVLLNWADYMHPEVLKEFERRHGVRVKQAYFESDAARDEVLVETRGGIGYDLAVVDGYSVRKLAKRGWLTPLDQARIPNLAHIDPTWRTALAMTETYGAPYFWGTVGIGYRTDLVPRPLTSWMDLFRPGEALRGKIAMIRDPVDMTSMALIALGHSINSTDPGHLADVEKLLMAQKPYVKVYHYVSLGEESALVTGDVAASMMYSGDALMVQEHDERIAYVVPEEGTNLWVDYLTVLQASQRKADAELFIDFINEPEIAARQAEFVYYATPNKAAEALLPAEFLEDPVIYPPPEVLKRSEFYKPIPARANRRRSGIFAQVIQ